MFSMEIVSHVCASSMLLMAQVDAESAGIPSLLRHLMAATVFSALGILVLLLCVLIFDRVAPFSFRKEILEDQNTALAIIVASILLGMSLIIAAAVHG